MAYAGNISEGGVQGRGSGLVWGRGAEPPGRRRIFENLQKIPEENWKKCCIFAYFATKISKPFAKFSRVWTKNTIVWGNFEKILEIFDKNSMENCIFIYFWENFLLKIETSEITSFFYNNFFRLGGVWTPLTPPAYATASVLHWNSTYKSINTVYAILLLFCFATLYKLINFESGPINILRNHPVTLEKEDGPSQKIQRYFKLQSNFYFSFEILMGYFSSLSHWGFRIWVDEISYF